AETPRRLEIIFSSGDCNRVRVFRKKSERLFIEVRHFAEEEEKMDHAIVLFDGDCNFCDSSVQFIINHDPAGYFHFASLQSEVGEKLSREYNIPDDVDSLVLIQNGEAYVKSEGALRISRHLTGLWKLAYHLRPFPAAIRDGAYDVI